MLEHCANVIGLERTLDAGVGEEVGWWRRDGDLEETVICAIRRYQAGPELELVGADGEIWLKRVEWRE